MSEKKIATGKNVRVPRGNVQGKNVRDAIIRKTESSLPDSLPEGIARIVGNTSSARVRNAGIIARVIAGDDVKIVADAFHLSPSRVRRIVKMCQGKIAGRFEGESRAYIGRDDKGQEMYVTQDAFLASDAFKGSQGDDDDA